MCGWWIPSRSNAAAPATPPAVRTWPDGPNTGTALPIPAGSGELRLHLVATLGGLPIAFALTGAKADERQTLLGILAADPALAAARPGQTLIADRQYYGTAFEADHTGAPVDRSLTAYDH